MMMCYHCLMQSWEVVPFDCALLKDTSIKQGDKEAALGLTVSPLCSRNATLLAASQIGYIKFVVQPYVQVTVYSVCIILQIWPTED
mmetsp:Transcript_4159/g.9238  ORF Transcript_4159/g.9238 Transcript_4159/m.9238 type:complete len:86 (-) Transcript_4159:623-880(-)